MATDKITCSNCGMDFQFDDSLSEVRCTHCGAMVYDRTRATKVQEGEGFNITFEYVKPVVVGSPLIIATIDEKDELQLRSRCPVTCKLGAGKHTIVLRATNIISAIKVVGSMDFDVDGDAKYVIKVDGSKDASITKSE